MEKETVVTAKLEDINSITQRLVVEVPADKIKRSIKTVMAKLKNEAEIPGFRKGKVPEEMIKQRLGEGYKDELLQQIVRDTYPEAVTLSGAIPISDPSLEPSNEEVDESKPYTYKAVFEIYPTVEPKNYEGLKLEKEKVSVSDDEVQQELLGLQRQMTQLEPAPNEALGKGLLARVDFEGAADGKKFDGSDAKDFIIDIDAANLLPEFEKQLLGMKEGEEKDVEVDYPKDYFNKEIAGKKGQFKVKVKELRKKIVPPLDDSFAKDIGKFETLNDVKKALKERIAEVKEDQQRGYLHRQVMEKLTAEQPIDVPEVMISRELGHMLEEVTRDLESQGRTLKEAGVDVNAFIKDHFDEALFRMRSYILSSAIAEKEGIKVSKEELNERLKAIATHSGQPESKVRKHFEDNNLMSGLNNQMMIEKALDFVVSKAKVKEKSPKKEKK